MNPSSAETRRLVVRAIDGERSALDELLAWYRPQLRRMVAVRMDSTPHSGNAGHWVVPRVRHWLNLPMHCSSSVDSIAWRFTLRMLLIATTLVAVVLGLIVVLTR
jgi:hypothetical protein